MAKITHCMKNKMQGIVAPHKVETSTITMPGGFYFSLYRDFLQGVYPKISNHDLGMILGNNPLEEISSGNMAFDFFHLFRGSPSLSHLIKAIS
jgi:hypothetical protein